MKQDRKTINAFDPSSTYYGSDFMWHLISDLSGAFCLN